MINIEQNLPKKKWAEPPIVLYVTPEQMDFINKKCKQYNTDRSKILRAFIDTIRDSESGKRKKGRTRRGA